MVWERTILSGGHIVTKYFFLLNIGSRQLVNSCMEMTFITRSFLLFTKGIAHLTKMTDAINLEEG